jgi:cold shock CspA family protein
VTAPIAHPDIFSIFMHGFETMSEPQFLEGTIKSYSGEYGFIIPDDETLPVIFLHVSVVKFCGQDCPLKDDRVRFRYSDRDGKLAARWVEIIG